MTDLRPGTPRRPSAATSLVPLRWRDHAPLVAAALAMQSVAWLLIVGVADIARDSYGFFSFSDIAGTYYPYAIRMAGGMAAYRDFFIEYPPLFVPLLAALGNPGSQSDFLMRFAALMVVFMLAAGVVTALAAVDDRSSRRPYVVASVFSALVLALGPITANRYDAVVALVLALALLFTMREDWELAGVALGVGFALKITPAMLVPLVLMLAPARRALRALAGFSVAALLPFLWVFLLGGESGARLAEMIGYHLTRPLEIESVMATGLWIGRLAGPKLDVVTGSGSQVIVSQAAVTIASVSTLVLLGALALTFALVWRRRSAILADKRLVALASLATMLGSLVGSKVLSPQYFVWIIPAAALVAVDRKVLGVILALGLLGTHVLFPANYLAFAYDQLPGPILLVIVRNLLVLGSFALSLWYLWSLPRVEQTADA
ncbi:MAG: glycosyltransferase family 87 protein [Coriobacteriia bacterium]|nr:glycosyltransferase family 87 protein [Coriobacteriia bacterium]